MVLDLPGVGRNLHDHLLSPVIFETTTREVGPPTPGLAAAQTHHFWRSRAGLDSPDTQPINFSVPMYSEEWMTGPEFGFSLMAGLVRPESRGAVTLTGPGRRRPGRDRPQRLRRRAGPRRRSSPPCASVARSVCNPPSRPSGVPASSTPAPGWSRTRSCGTTSAVPRSPTTTRSARAPWAADPTRWWTRRTLRVRGPRGPAGGGRIGLPPHHQRQHQRTRVPGRGARSRLRAGRPGLSPASGVAQVLAHGTAAASTPYAALKTREKCGASGRPQRAPISATERPACTGSLQHLPAVLEASRPDPGGDGRPFGLEDLVELTHGDEVGRCHPARRQSRRRRGWSR